MEFRWICAGDPEWSHTAAYVRACTWRAGAYLADRMENGRFSDWERVLVAREQDGIAGFCEVVKEDCIPGLPYTPYISTLFVEESRRGQRLGEALITCAMAYLKTVGFSTVYLFSDHVGLYEKYGFTAVARHKAPWGEIQTLYCRDIL